MIPEVSARSRLTRVHPRNCWYMIATSEEVGGKPLGRRALDTGVVLYRTTDGSPVALQDRCAHRPYPLSLGHIEGDNIVSGYTGFVYDPRGFCVHVPTQSEIPVGARVRAYPVHEDGVFVWAWLGELAGWPAAAARHPWLNDPRWATLGDVWETEADLLLLHENFADITHVAVVDPFIAPPVLRSSRRRRSRWRSPRRRSRSPERTSPRRFLPGKRSFSAYRATPNTCSMSKAPS